MLIKSVKIQIRSDDLVVSESGKSNRTSASEGGGGDSGNSGAKPKAKAELPPSQHAKIIQYLISQGAMIESRDLRGWTALTKVYINTY